MTGRRPHSREGRARAWLEHEVAALWQSPAPPQRSAASEAGLRAMVALLLQPVEPYLGLTLEEARALARTQRRTLVDRTGEVGGGRGTDWRADRLTVVLGPDGRVVSAETDGDPWD